MWHACGFSEKLYQTEWKSTVWKEIVYHTRENGWRIDEIVGETSQNSHFLKLLCYGKFAPHDHTDLFEFLNLKYVQSASFSCYFTLGWMTPFEVLFWMRGMILSNRFMLKFFPRPRCTHDEKIQYKIVKNYNCNFNVLNLQIHLCT